MRCGSFLSRGRERSKLSGLGAVEPGFDNVLTLGGVVAGGD